MKLLNEHSRLCVLVFDTSCRFVPIGTSYTILWRRRFSGGDRLQPDTVQIIISGLPADTLPEARAARPTGTVPFLLSRFFSYTGKRKKKKKDEVGQSGVLPLPAADRPCPVLFWDESSRTLEVQLKALLPVGEVQDQAQLGVESVLCTGGVHGFRPPLCRKGRARGLSKSLVITGNVSGWMENCSFMLWRERT